MGKVKNELSAVTGNTNESGKHDPADDPLHNVSNISWDLLPQDVLLEIYRHLLPEDLRSLLMINHHLKTLPSTNSAFWKHQLEIHFSGTYDIDNIYAGIRETEIKKLESAPGSVIWHQIFWKTYDQESTNKSEALLFHEEWLLSIKDSASMCTNHVFWHTKLKECFPVILEDIYKRKAEHSTIDYQVFWEIYRKKYKGLSIKDRRWISSLKNNSGEKLRSISSEQFWNIYDNGQWFYDGKSFQQGVQFWRLVDDPKLLKICYETLQNNSKRKIKLAICCKRPYKLIKELMTNDGQNHSYSEILYHLILADHRDAVLSLIAKHKPLLEQSYLGKRPLTLAVLACQPAIVNALMENGAQVEDTINYLSLPENQDLLDKIDADTKRALFNKYYESNWQGCYNHIKGEVHDLGVKDPFLCKVAAMLCGAIIGYDHYKSITFIKICVQSDATTILNYVLRKNPENMSRVIVKSKNIELLCYLHAKCKLTPKVMENMLFSAAKYGYLQFTQELLALGANCADGIALRCALKNNRIDVAIAIMTTDAQYDITTKSYPHLQTLIAALMEKRGLAYSKDMNNKQQLRYTKGVSTIIKTALLLEHLQGKPNTYLADNPTLLEQAEKLQRPLYEAILVAAEQAGKLVSCRKFLMLKNAIDPDSALYKVFSIRKKHGSSFFFSGNTDPSIIEKLKSEIDQIKSVELEVLRPATNHQLNLEVSGTKMPRIK